MVKWREVVWISLEDKAKLEEITKKTGKPTNIIAAEIIHNYLNAKSVPEKKKEVIIPEVKPDDRQLIPSVRTPGSTTCRVCGKPAYCIARDVDGHPISLCQEHFKQKASNNEILGIIRVL
jgi:ribosomal protein S14